MRSVISPPPPVHSCVMRLLEEGLEEGAMLKELQERFLFTVDHRYPGLANNLLFASQLLLLIPWIIFSS